MSFGDPQHQETTLTGGLWTRKLRQLLQAGKAVAFDFSRHGHLWLRSNFYALIVQNLTSKLIRKIYAAFDN